MTSLAQDIIVISIGGTIVRLRPSLRAALRLERQFGGFRALLQALDDGSVNAVTAILAETGDHPVPESLIAAPSPEPLRDRLDRLQPQLVLLVLQLADVSPPEIDDETAQAPEKITMEEALAQIFGLATGVLGWTPATAWAATPAEIWAAMDARLAMHRAANGIPSPKRNPTGPDQSQLDSDGLASLAALND